MKLDRVVAVKIPRKGQLDREETEKFLREARAAAQLQHPGIVSVHEVGIEGQTVYIVSDFIQGLSLEKWLAGQRPTSRQAAALGIRIAEALHHAHEHGVIHRDLKPGNIMIDTAGKPHVMDFGLAKCEAGEITMTVEGQIMGTPAYMSPEQAKGEGHRVDRRTDVYSLGAVLFELLTGERPFRGNVRMLLKQVVEDEPPSLRKLEARVPRDLETITLKCMEKDPAHRYATAHEAADDLRHYLAGEPIHARPASRPERLWRWCNRQPVVAGLASAIVLLLLLGTAVSSYFAITATVQRNRADVKAAEAQAEKKNALAEKSKAQVAERESQSQRLTAETEKRKSQRQLALSCIDRGVDELRAWRRFQGPCAARPGVPRGGRREQRRPPPQRLFAAGGLGTDKRTSTHARRRRKARGLQP